MYSLNCQCRLEKYILFLGNLHPFYIYKWVNIAQEDKKVRISKKEYICTAWSINEGLSGNLWTQTAEIYGRFSKNRQDHWHFQLCTLAVRNVIVGLELPEISAFYWKPTGNLCGWFMEVSGQSFINKPHGISQGLVNFWKVLQSQPFIVRLFVIQVSYTGWQVFKWGIQN